MSEWEAQNQAFHLAFELQVPLHRHNMHAHPAAQGLNEDSNRAHCNSLSFHRFHQCVSFHPIVESFVEYPEGMRYYQSVTVPGLPQLCSKPWRVPLMSLDKEVCNPGSCSMPQFWFECSRDVVHESRVQVSCA